MKMMTTFHVIHIVVGLWLALVNATNILTESTLAWNNLVLGLIVAGYNVYYLFARKNVDVQS
ncbi:MAG TPA: hypothetical protein PLZ49_08990 [Bacillota bacterium]|jgi:flagellar biosynthesis protein FliQ|nr:hypothetical protein [Bacillota bacterium]HQE09950.1 hypothetical protein [Bacillota bacterium]